MATLFDTLAAREVQKKPAEDPTKREWVTFTKPDNTKETVWGNENFAPLPEGELLDVVHNHPNGSSLSVGDLSLLSRVGRVEAQGNKRYSAKRGPKYDELMQHYDKIAAKVASDMAHEKAIRGRNLGPGREELINRELAKRQIIEYLEEVLPKKK